MQATQEQPGLEESLRLLALEPESESRWSQLAAAMGARFGAQVEIAAFHPARVLAAFGRVSNPACVESLRLQDRIHGELRVSFDEGSSPSAHKLKQVEFCAAMITCILEHTVIRKEMQQFIHGVTHDLRGSLVRANNMAQLMSRQARLDGDGEQLQSHLHENLLSAEQLLKSLAAFASAGSRPEELKSVELQSIAEMVRWNLKSALTERNAELIIEGGDTLLRMREREIADVVARLVDNALKFGGHRIVIRGEQLPQGARVSVEDDGTGIGEAYRDRVMEPFQRLHGKQYPGHGLGLPICRKLVEGHGGRIWIDSAHTGTAVRFELPGTDQDPNDCHEIT